LLRFQPTPATPLAAEVLAFDRSKKLAEEVGSMEFDALADVMLMGGQAASTTVEAQAAAVQAATNVIQAHAKAVVESLGRGSRKGKPSKSARKQINSLK